MLFAFPAYAADFQPVWQNTILPHEGGYSNNIHDPGNWTGGKEGKGRFLGTKYGIAASVYGTSLLKKGIIIKHLTKDQAAEIFKRDYWNALYLGDLKSQGIADELCDEVVNTGKGQTEKLLERVFAEIEWAQKKPIPVPARFIPETMAWINEYTRERNNRISFYNSIRIKRIKFYINLVHKKPKMKEFLLSWVDRSCD
jgi:lysozyme family protein